MDNKYIFNSRTQSNSGRCFLNALIRSSEGNTNGLSATSIKFKDVISNTGGRYLNLFSFNEITLRFDNFPMTRIEGKFQSLFEAKSNTSKLVNSRRRLGSAVKLLLYKSRNLMFFEMMEKFAGNSRIRLLCNERHSNSNGGLNEYKNSWIHSITSDNKNLFVWMMLLSFKAFFCFIWSICSLRTGKI